AAVDATYQPGAPGAVDAGQPQGDAAKGAAAQERLGREQRAAGEARGLGRRALVDPAAVVLRVDCRARGEHDAREAALEDGEDVLEAAQVGLLVGGLGAPRGAGRV